MRTDIEKHIAQYASSGLSAKAYCELHGIPIATFYGWLKAAKTKSLSGPARFLQISGKEPEFVEVELRSGIKVKARADIDLTVLRRIVEVLDASHS